MYLPLKIDLISYNLLKVIKGNRIENPSDKLFGIDLVGVCPFEFFKILHRHSMMCLLDFHPCIEKLTLLVPMEKLFNIFYWSQN